MSKNSYLELITDPGCQKFWSFLSLRDIINLSLSSNESRNLVLGEEAVAEIIARTSLGPWKINAFQSLKLFHLSRILRMLQSPLDVILLFDDRNGRMVLDVGSTDEDLQRGGLLSAPEEQETEEDVESQTIFRQLERCSYDEYDDFQPRHPMPKDRAHRRGDSYFNSDIETVVNEISGGMSSGTSADLRAMARSALEGSPADQPAATGNAAKNRILARARNNGGAASAGTPTKAGLPPTAPKRE
eukprot:gene7015-7759_t